MTFTLQRTLKMLEKSGVRNVVFTDCLKQRDDNIKKVKIISTLLQTLVSLQKFAPAYRVYKVLVGTCIYSPLFCSWCQHW